jgi:hypothetical protein
MKKLLFIVIITIAFGCILCFDPAKDAASIESITFKTYKTVVFSNPDSKCMNFHLSSTHGVYNLSIDDYNDVQHTAFFKLKTKHENCDYVGKTIKCEVKGLSLSITSSGQTLELIFGKQGDAYLTIAIKYCNQDEVNKRSLEQYLNWIAN